MLLIEIIITIAGSEILIEFLVLPVNKFWHTFYAFSAL